MATTPPPPSASATPSPGVRIDPQELRGALWRLITLAAEHQADPSDPAALATLRKVIGVAGMHDAPAMQNAELKLTADAHDAVTGVYREVRRNARAAKNGTEPEMTFKEQERALVAALRTLHLVPSTEDLAALALEPEEITDVKDGPALAADRTLAQVLPAMLARRRARMAWLRKHPFADPPQGVLAKVTAAPVHANTIANRRKAAKRRPTRAPGASERDVVSFGLEVLLGPLDPEYRTVRDALDELFP